MKSDSVVRIMAKIMGSGQKIITNQIFAMMPGPIPRNILLTVNTKHG